MRRPSAQSALGMPLNQLMGGQANVRVLRVLASASEPLSMAELARRARITRTSVSQATRRLLDAGLLETVGVDAGQLLQFRSTHPLAHPVQALFRAEQQRMHDVMKQLRERLRDLGPAILGAWIEGPVAQGQDEIEDAMRVRLVAPSGELSSLRKAFQPEAARIEREFDLTIELIMSSRADMEAAPPAEREQWRHFQLLHGLPPENLVAPAKRDTPLGSGTPSAARTHADADLAALARARQAAQAIRRDPGLVTRARDLLREQIATAPPRVRPTLEEWDEVLNTMSLTRLRRFLVDPGERATRLRQSLPFAGLISTTGTE